MIVINGNWRMSAIDLFWQPTWKTEQTHIGHAVLSEIIDAFVLKLTGQWSSIWKTTTYCFESGRRDAIPMQGLNCSRMQIAWNSLSYFRDYRNCFVVKQAIFSNSLITGGSRRTNISGRIYKHLTNEHQQWLEFFINFDFKGSILLDKRLCSSD